MRLVAPRICNERYSLISSIKLNRRIMQNGSKTSQRKTNRLHFPPSGALLHLKTIKIPVGNWKPRDPKINIRSASNFTSVGIYNVMRNINWIDQSSRIECTSIGAPIN